MEDPSLGRAIADSEARATAVAGRVVDLRRALHLLGQLIAPLCSLTFERRDNS